MWAYSVLLSKNSQSLMIDYVQTDVNNNFYLNLNTGITFEGMKMFSADPLELNPKATAHITKYF